jgi:hypothetical protein
MATQAYYDWLNHGSPWKMATPVREYRNAFLLAGWPAESLGTIGDKAHLSADRPQDHTPFSVTGWPGASPYPYVLAFDAGHNPDAGRDMGPVVAHWLSDARAGKTPWVKYIVWRGQLFDVRNGWSPVSASDHYDHAHVSIRTDWYDKTIGAYAVIPGGSTNMGMSVETFIQTGLQQAGFDPGGIDGDLGPNSLAAFVKALKTKGEKGEPGEPGKDGRTPVSFETELVVKAVGFTDAPPVQGA